MQSSAREIYYNNQPGRMETERITRTAQQRREQQMRARKREQRRRAKRRRQIAFFMWQCAVLLTTLFCAWKIGQCVKVDKNFLRTEESDSFTMQENMDASTAYAWGVNGLQGDEYIEQVGLDYVDAPVKRNEEEVLVRLSELALDNEKIQTVLENKDAYPDNMLDALANNPEMVDFVLGYATMEHGVNGGLTQGEMEQEHPLFLQWDPRWGYVSYGDNSCVGLAGCGPTCLSMALYELTRDASLTPDYIAEYAMEHDYYMFGTGTQWALMDEVPLRYGIEVEKPGIDEYTMKQHLDAGHVLICAMRPGDFTARGHFIVIYGYDENGFLINDPNCVARSRKSWSYDRINGQIKQLWSLGNK